MRQAMFLLNSPEIENKVNNGERIKMLLTTGKSDFDVLEELYLTALARRPQGQEKAAALNGVIVQMFNHGITASALFYFVGLIEQRAGRRGLDDFGGLRKVAPVFCGLMGFLLMVLAFCTVSAVLGKSTLRGLTALFVGLAMGLIGIDQITGQ